MSDARLRELERRWQESGQDEDEGAYLQELARLGSPYRFGPFVTCSPEVKRLCEGARAAARDARPVLLLGEGGSGRATLARAIHDASERRAGPFVRQGSLRNEAHLQEATLFGAQYATWSEGDDGRRPGLLERCAGGTALVTLYESIDLSLELRLLSLAREGVVWPVGADREGAPQVNARLVVRADPHALEHDPGLARLAADAGEDGSSWHVLRVPPLRERLCDLDLLIAELSPSPAPPLPAPLLERLRALSWPENGRELRWRLEALREEGAAALERLLSGEVPAEEDQDGYRWRPPD